MHRSIILVGALLISFPASAEPGDASIDIILNSAGLSDLSDTQRVEARSLVRRLVARSSASDTLTESAINYLDSEGYKPVHLGAVTIDGKDYLIASESGLSYATADVPMMLNMLTFREGNYFAKSSYLGGVSEFIDQSGRVQRLFLAKWFKLK